MKELRRRFGRVEVPDEHEARERAWAVVAAAYAEREPVPRRRRRVAPVLAFAAVVAAAAVAAVLSPPGRAVLDSVRDRIAGVESAEPALFALPGDGRLLVDSPRGPWIVGADGSRRLLAGWTEASWSPFGRYVVAARRNELAALEPDGTVRWSLARPDVRFPRWHGDAANTAVAFLTGSRLHVVAGDGTRDTDACGLHAAARVAPAWRPGARFVLAYVTTRGRVFVFDAARCSLFYAERPVTSAPFRNPRLLLWSDDGERLLLVTDEQLVVFGTESARPLSVRTLRGVVDAAFEPGTHRVALAREGEVLLLDLDVERGAPETVFAGPGRFDGIAWAPDGSRLAVAWHDADQWLFLGPDGEVEAAAGIRAQFGRFAQPAEWCCRASRSK